MTCYILDSAGASHEVSNEVLDSAGASYEIDGYVLDSAGTEVLVCVVTVTEVQNAGGEDPGDKRRRYRLIAAKNEDKLWISVIKTYMKQVY